MNSPRHLDPFPEPPSAGAILRWLAALPVRLGMVRHWRWWLIGSMLAIVLLAVLRAPIGALLWPQTRAQALRADAGQALAEGRLTAADGSGARELFEAALAMDPDRAEARQGLAQVALAALEQARIALAGDRFDDARRNLALARALSVPRAEADALADALRQREAGHAGVDGLFAHAEDAHAQGRLDGGVGSALPLYAHVLALEPAHAGALRGREDALAELLAQAREALRAGDVVDAARLVATVRTYDPGHVDLPDTLARLMEEARLDDEGLARLLAGEGQAVRADPRGVAAAAGGGAGIDAGERARRVRALLAQADAALSAGNLVDATGSGAADRVAAARVLDPASADVAAAALRLLPLVRECHLLELRSNSLRRAGMCLEAREALGDDTGELSMARRQLAERWLAVGDERLGAGEIANARSALAAARVADPLVPGLSDFELRVRAAAAAHRME
ncbi:MULTISPECIES: hypothetical protein [unclassified Luteimonas]|uniref:hypothetical protein n=1 Tax=unclassified Luteimonas TaxID=2629088 RepID=UPI0018F0D83D|nr:MULTISPECIES: hypothetical protein [unclassified Luteimonas]MBJ6980155.1 hypothetical protein [Luteimonas sp. MC1895]MBJ6985366.1 hypothetical protein [Luteimonas sp. MC1750]QQO05374.1 hypothetical protein JGR68_11090 [Luteimonas sp. MC1750]